MARSQGRVPRLYCEQTLSAGSELTLPREASHYLVTVLRCDTGAPVRLFNAIDGEWQCVVSHANRKAARVTCEERLREATPPPDIDYLFAPLKSARLDYLAQKATEMGARRIRPVITRHTVAAKVNLERMRANAIEAAEQCNMVYVPDVADPEKLTDVLAGWPDERTLFFCDERAGQSNPVDTLKQVKPGPMAVLLGPEGGFSEEERDLILALPNVVALSLGPRIMRADTAAVAVLALVQSVLGDWCADK
ncbi:MAG: 16S rRNA (uracil(1498)-N(3))-methyltransferase [Pseudomonadota bacterium]